MRLEFLDSAPGILQWVAKTSLSASALILVYLAVELLPAKIARPRWRYALGLLVVARLLIPSVPESSVSVWNIAPMPEPRPLSESALVLRSAEPLPFAGSNVLTHTSSSSPTGGLYAFLIWLGGACFIAGIATWRWARLARFVRRRPRAGAGVVADELARVAASLRVRKVPSITLIDGSGVPALFGFRRPVLLWPQDFERHLSATELRMTLVHELSHLKRGDALVNLFALAARALHWCNPLVWLATSRLARAQEFLSDAAALQDASGEERQRYGQALLALASGRAIPRVPPPGLLPFLQRNSEIKRRIHMMITFRKPRRFEALVGAMALAALATVTFTRAAQQTAEPPLAAAAATAPAKSPEIPKPAATEQSPPPPTRQSRLNDLRASVEKARNEEREMRYRLKEIEEGLGSNSRGETRKALEAERVSAMAKRLQLEGQIAGLRPNVEKSKWAALLAAHPDPTLREAFEAFSKAERQYAVESKSKGGEHRDIIALRAQMAVIDKQLGDQANAILDGLEVQRRIQESIEQRMSKMIEETHLEGLDRRAQAQHYRREHEEALHRYQQLSAELAEESKPRF